MCPSLQSAVQHPHEQKSYERSNQHYSELLSEEKMHPKYCAYILDLAEIGVV